MMAALLRQGARTLGRSLLQRTQASTGLLPRRRMLFNENVSRMLSTDKLVPEEITRDIQRRQQELCDAIDKGKRSLEAATDWRKQQKLFDAIANARRGVTAATNWCDEDPQEYFRRTKSLQIFLGCIKLLFIVPVLIGQIIGIGYITYFLVGFVWVATESILKEKAEKKRAEAQKKRVQ